jgi:iron complex transport system ATP-binding protein
MIEFAQVSVRYRGASRAAVDGVSFSAPLGAVTAVVGPNGSGKSTLVRALLGRVSLAAGRISVGGDDVGTLARRDIARRMAVLVQREDPAFPLSVAGYVALGRYAHDRPWRATSGEDDPVVASALETAGASALRDRRTDELSGGEWQRVRIARALAQGGQALVLDEPSTFLDVAHEMSQFELLAALARGGKAVLLVSHQLNLVARFATTIVLLDEGAIVAHGAPADVMRGEILERVYRWPLVVSRDPAVGAPMLVPLRTPTSP